MTTYTMVHTLPGISSGDADFGRLITEYRAILLGCGLVRTADAGQVDVATVIRPSSSLTAAGYDIWRFDDVLQADAPIFLKIEYGTGNGTASYFQVWVTLGQGSDGAGNLTGIRSSRISSYGYPAAVTGVTSYSCHTEGFLGVINRANGSNDAWYVGAGSFVVCRSCDANGFPTSAGAYILVGDTNVAAQAIRFTDGAAVINASPSTSVALFPLDVMQSVAGEIPFIPMWLPLPQLTPVFGLAAYPNKLIPIVDYIDISMVGSRSRRYLALQGGLSSRNSSLGFAMLWE